MSFLLQVQAEAKPGQKATTTRARKKSRTKRNGDHSEAKLDRRTSTLACSTPTALLPSPWMISATRNLHSPIGGHTQASGAATSATTGRSEPSSPPPRDVRIARQRSRGVVRLRLCRPRFGGHSSGRRFSAVVFMAAMVVATMASSVRTQARATCGGSVALSTTTGGGFFP